MIRRTPHQVSCKLDDEVAVLEFTSARYFGMNGVGALIWASLETPQSLDGLCEDVMRCFDVDRDRCRDDIARFLRRLHDRGLIEITA